MRKLIELGASIGAAICAADEYDGGYNFERDMKIRDALMALPTVDAVEVVRCKDCKHWYSDADTGMACEFTNMGQPDDGFCNWGERKDGEQNG